MLTSRQKADALAICAISIGLPAYYKVKFFLGGQIGWKEIWSPAGLIEIVWAFCLACLLVVLYRKVGPLLASKMPNASKRFMPLLTVAMSALVAVAFTRFFFVYVVEWGSGDAFEFDIALLAIMLPLILSGVGERIFLEGKAKEQALKASMAETEALTAKYEALKARLSPHFLFNSLNTLADIVEDDPKLAVRFIDKMAETYRYILDNRDKQTVSLKEEVESSVALLFVLETLHPSALSVSIDLPVTGQDWEVVPLTLQTLLENALKHNHYSSSAPLEVRVYGDGGELVVENKLNKRTQVPSTKVGLDSLMQRVGQVCGRPVAIVEDGLKFQVRVPMLRPTVEAVR